MVLRPVGREAQVGTIPLAFRVGIFAEDDDGDVRLFRKRTGFTVFRSSPGTDHSCLDPSKDRCCRRKILVAVTGTLPGERPAPALLADVVGAIASNEHPLLPCQRQKSAFVLQQHQ